MAKLFSKNSKINLEVSIVKDNGYLNYFFNLKLDKTPIFNDKVFKRNNQYWKQRPRGGMLGEEFGTEHLVPLISSVIDTLSKNLTVECHWKTLDPDIQISFKSESSEHIFVTFRINSFILKEQELYSDDDFLEIGFETTLENLTEFIKQLNEDNKTA